MPSINAVFNRQTGPVIEIVVGVTQARADALAAAGQAVPNWITARVLIDTGASGTCLDPTIIQPLGLQPTGVIQVQTPSTNGIPHQMLQYDVRLWVSSPQSGRFFDALPITESHFKSQGIDGLLGRDVLEGCVLITNGEAGIVTLAF